jgi:hypothetical protein
MSDSNGATSESERPTFASKLELGRQRFLAHAIEHSLAIGRRSPRDFVRHFTPKTIMQGLADKPEIRADILAYTTGLKKRIAIKKAWESAAEDLQIALDEGETTAAAIVEVFQPDERVRYLDAKKIWTFLTDGEFWKASTSKKQEYAAAKQHVAFMLTRALEDRLITHRDVVEGISVSEIAMRLPKEELGKIIGGALKAGQSNAPFTEVELLSAMPPEVLVEYVPLPHIFVSAIVPKIAEVHGYVEPARKGASSLEPATLSPTASAEPAGESASAEAAAPSSLAPVSQGERPDWVDMDDEEVADDEISDDDFASA